MTREQAWLQPGGLGNRSSSVCNRGGTQFWRARGSADVSEMTYTEFNEFRGNRFVNEPEEVAQEVKYRGTAPLISLTTTVTDVREREVAAHTTTHTKRSDDLRFSNYSMLHPTTCELGASHN